MTDDYRARHERLRAKNRDLAELVVTADHNGRPLPHDADETERVPDDGEPERDPAAERREHGRETIRAARENGTPLSELTGASVTDPDRDRRDALHRAFRFSGGGSPEQRVTDAMIERLEFRRAGLLGPPERGR